jgi:beta-glucosidase/6-phospho-beta-glucosidase/beta-galactosidase/ABC-type amino acid transport substrate-binding protein
MLRSPRPSYALPESFMFGVATADHQCEAYDPNYEDIRDIWEQRCHLTLRGRATNFWNRYPEDIRLAQELGCKSFRFSLAWSRLEPAPGRFNDEAFVHYQHLIETIHAAGMEPIMTLHHFTWPTHVQDRGGTIGTDFPDIFVSYVKEVVSRLGQQVRYWITFNEPSQLIYGYIKPWWELNYFTPPGLPGNVTLTDQMEAIGRLMRNLFLAHTAARNVIKQGNPAALVGTNPMLLGLPAWLQKLVDRNVTGLHSLEDWLHQGHRFARRGLIEHGKVDIALATLTMTPERARQVDFSEAYFIAHQALLVKTNSPVKDRQDLAGKAVAVVKRSTSEDVISTLVPGASARVVDTYTHALQELDGGYVVAILADDTILRGLMQQHPDRYELLSNQLTTEPEPYAAAVAKGNPELLEAVDGAVRHFKNSGAWAASFAQHFPGQPVPQPPQLGVRVTLTGISEMNLVKSAGTPAVVATSHKTLLERIKARGHLVVAVKEDVPGFGYRDPQTGKLSGLEIDLARAIAQDICGDPNKVVFWPAQTGERLSLVRSLLRIFDPLFKLYSIFSTALTSNWWHLGMAGKLPEFLCPSSCVGQQDFVGFDYYWGINTLQIHRIQQLMDAAFGRFDQAPVWPEALYSMLKYHAKLFPDKEILIIENGCVDKADGIERARYISEHIHQVQRAHRNGVKVSAYTCWSITSNREWGLKFSPASNFGLYHIELDTDPELKRVPSAAVAAYRKIIQNNGEA